MTNPHALPAGMTYHVSTYDEASRICQKKMEKSGFTIEYEPRRYVDGTLRAFGVWPINGLGFDIITDYERD